MIIGVDFGKRIGIAYAIDSIAMPWCVVNSIDDLASKIQEKRAKFLVIGLPKLLDGKEGEQCLKTREMLQKLFDKIGTIDYTFQDERFSSKFVAGNDSNSAAWILQIYLNQIK